MIEVAGHSSALRFNHDGFEFFAPDRPSHDFDVGRRLEKYPADLRVLYLDRDPREVMVSHYHQIAGRYRDKFAFSGDLTDFIRDPYFGAPVLARFRAMWQEILDQRTGFLRLSYGGIHADPAEALRSILSYFDLVTDRETFERALTQGRFDEMRALESSGLHPEPWLQVLNGSYKVRRGRAGRFADELSRQDVIYLNEIFGL